jgi:hypothetical protein
MLARLVAVLLPLALFLGGCQSLASRATTRMAENISAAVLDQRDTAIVRDGGPAYLIAIDGMIEGDPESETLLLAGARLYSAYASAFVTEPARLRLLTEHALGYAERALCLRRTALCGARDLSFDAFERALAEADRDDVPALYGLGAAWATWVQASSSDWDAIADLPRVQALMERVVALDSGYDSGMAHLYLGVLYTLRPASMGGRPADGRRHFEAAIELSQGRNLQAKVLFARQYARLVFDRALHDRLLREVLESDPEAEGFTLANVLAQEEARALLAESDEYF